MKPKRMKRRVPSFAKAMADMTANPPYPADGVGGSGDRGVAALHRGYIPALVAASGREPVCGRGVSEGALRDSKVR